MSAPLTRSEHPAEHPAQRATGHPAQRATKHAYVTKEARAPWRERVEWGTQ
jgi:hypothetical protein